MFDKTAANPTSDPSATPTSTTDPWTSITLGVTTTFGVFIACCILAGFIKCCESIIKMNRKSRNQDDGRPDEDDGRGRSSWPRRSSNSPILPTTHRPTTGTNEGNDEDEMNRWMRGTANRRQDADLRINLLEQKVEELYYAINKVQDDHEKLASVIEEVACEILSEVATMGDSGTEMGSRYSSCKSDMRKSGDISELPGTEELLGRETPSDQLDDFPIPDRPFRIGRRTTPPPIPAKSSKRFDPFSPENPFLDPPGPRRTPHRFTFEFGKGSSRPTSPIPYIPPPRPPPHGSLAPAPSLNSNQPISACAYYAPVEKKESFAPRQQEANERDGRARTSSSTSADHYRHGGEDREVRYRRPTGWQVSSSANDERPGGGHFAAAHATTPHADDVGRARFQHGRHVGPGGFGTRDEALDALEWEYSPSRGWTSRQPFSWSGADFAGANIDPSTPAQGQVARFDWRDRRPAQVDCGSSSSSSEDSASDGSGETDSSDETVRPARFGETEQREDERALHGRRESPETPHQTAHHYGPMVPEFYIPSTGRDNNRNTHPRLSMARYSSLHQQQHLLVASHDILGLAALVLLNFDENDGFPRGVDPVVRHRQGSILWTQFWWQPTPHRHELMWMHRRQIEDNIVWYIQNYCNDGDRALDVDVPTCERQARAIVSTLFRRARQSPRGQVTLQDLWRSYQHRLSMLSH